MLLLTTESLLYIWYITAPTENPNIFISLVSFQDKNRKHKKGKHKIWECRFFFFSFRPKFLTVITSVVFFWILSPNYSSPIGLICLIFPKHSGGSWLTMSKNSGSRKLFVYGKIPKTTKNRLFTSFASFMKKHTLSLITHWPNSFFSCTNNYARFSLTVPKNFSCRTNFSRRKTGKKLKTMLLQKAIGILSCFSRLILHGWYAEAI